MGGAQRRAQIKRPAGRSSACAYAQQQRARDKPRVCVYGGKTKRLQARREEDNSSSPGGNGSQLYSKISAPPHKDNESGIGGWTMTTQHSHHCLLQNTTGCSYNPSEARRSVCEGIHGATVAPVQSTAAGLEREGPAAAGRATENQTRTDEVPDSGRDPQPRPHHQRRCSYCPHGRTCCHLIENFKILLHIWHQ